MTSRAIVLGFSRDLAFAAGALLASILAHDSAFDATVIIYHDGLEKSQQAAFLKLWPNCRFRHFTAGDVAERLGVAVDDVRVAPYLSHFTPMVMTKLELPDLLDDFERVIWFDSDILVRGQLDALWAFDCLAWRPLTDAAFGRRKRMLDAFRHLELDPTVPLLNGGVIGVSREFGRRGGSGQAIHALARQMVERGFGAQIAEFPWYLVAASLALPVTLWPIGCNHPVTSPGAQEALVTHAIGKHKFWNAAPLLHLYPDWSRHHATWVACGGIPYGGSVALTDTHPLEPSALLHAADMRAYWESILPILCAALPKGMHFEPRHDRKWVRILLHGHPDTQHLRLLRTTNSRRLGLDPQLPAPLANTVADAICRAVPDVRREKRSVLSVPIGQIGSALAVAASLIPET